MEHLEEGIRRGEVTHTEVMRHCASLVVGDALAPETCLKNWRRLANGALESVVTLIDGRTIRQLAAPIRDAQGQRLGMLFLDENVTDRTRAEAQLRQLVERTPEAMAVHRAGTLVYANPASMRMLGYDTIDEIIGRSVLECPGPTRTGGHSSTCGWYWTPRSRWRST
jgi:PAS domain-containing protein